MTDASGTRALARALDLLQLIAANGGGRPLSELAGEAGLSTATAHRIANELASRGLVARVGRGLYCGGMGLALLGEAVDRTAVLSAVARPELQRLARTLGRTVHLGIWSGDMVTYVVKEAPPGAPPLFTREGMELEAYCSAVGKVLLAHLPAEERHRYLAGGPFVALTEKTITDPATLEQHLASVLGLGYALDDAEVMDGLYCAAVPVTVGGHVLAALSASTIGEEPQGDASEALQKLLNAASQIARCLGASTPGNSRRTMTPHQESL